MILQKALVSIGLFAVKPVSKYCPKINDWSKITLEMSMISWSEPAYERLLVWVLYLCEDVHVFVKAPENMADTQRRWFWTAQSTFI
jgi:hypothetical protein